MTDRPCPLCGTALPPGAVICAGSITQTRLALREVPDLLAELDLTITRQATRTAGSGTPRCGREDCTHGPDEPGCVLGVASDFDGRAADARTALVTTLHDWAHTWDQETPIGTHPGMRRIRTLIVSTTRWQAKTLAAVRDLGARDWAVQMATDVLSAVDEGWRAVDRPPDSTIVGRCPSCTTTLYAPKSAITVHCRVCGHRGDRSEIRDASLAESRVLLTAVDLAKILGIDPDRVYQWRRRERITPVRCDLHGRPLYRIADGQALLAGPTEESA